MFPRFYLRLLPRARAWRHGAYYATTPSLGCFARTSLMIAFLIILARLLGAQVDAVLQVHGRDAEMRVANPTATPLRVSITLFRDSTLTDSVAARISPCAFTLAPGASQTVRLEPIGPQVNLRLGTTFTPLEAEPEPPRPTMRFILATRIITRVRAAP